MNNKLRYQNLACASLAACTLTLAADTGPIDLPINEGEGSEPGEVLAVLILDERVPGPFDVELNDGETPGFGAIVESADSIDDLGEIVIFSDLFVSIDEGNHVEVTANDGSFLLASEAGDDTDLISTFFKDIQVYVGDAFGDGGGPFVASDDPRELDLSLQPESDWGFSASSGPYEEGDSFQFGFRYREGDLYPFTDSPGLIDLPATEPVDGDFFYGSGEIRVGSAQATGFQVSGAPGSPVFLGGATVSAVPEPSSVMALAGLLGLGLVSRHRS